MKTSTILIAALVLIIVFVGGMSASELVRGESFDQSAMTIEISFDLKQMVESSKTQISEQSHFDRGIRGLVVNDFERPL